MLELGQDLPFAPEATQHFGGVGPALQDLDRDLFLEFTIGTFRDIDGAHPTTSDRRESRLRARIAWCVGDDGFFDLDSFPGARNRRGQIICLGLKSACGQLGERPLPAYIDVLGISGDKLDQRLGRSPQVEQSLCGIIDSNPDANIPVSHGERSTHAEVVRISRSETFKKPIRLERKLHLQR